MVWSTEAGTMKYANPIFEALKGIVLTPDSGRGISVRTDLAEIKGTTAVAVYVEIDFHDVPEVANWLVSEHDLIAETIFKGVCNGAGIAYQAPDDCSAQIAALQAEIETLKNQVSALQTKIANATAALK